MRQRRTDLILAPIGALAARIGRWNILGMMVITGAGVIAACSTVRGIGEDLGHLSDAGKYRESETALAYRDQPEIRVRVHKGSEAAKFEGAPKFVIRPTGGGTSKIVPGPVTVAANGGGVAVRDGTGKLITVGSGVDAEIIAYDGTGDVWPPAGSGKTSAAIKPGTASRSDLVGAGSVLGAPTMRIDGVTYPGFATIRPRSADGPEKFDVVVAMPIEDYLPGVVSREMFPRWALRAYEAQAVCSRSYALHERDRNRRAGNPFDVDANESDQVYGGSALQREVQDAVRNTRGLVLTHKGAVLRAYFSSTCGGRPSSAAKVWPSTGGSDFNLAAPLQGKPRESFCEKSAWYRWEATRTDEELSQRLRAWGRTAGNPIKNITRVRAIDPKERNDADRPVSYEVTDDRGSKYVLSAEELRNACNAPVDSLPTLTRESRVHSGDLLAEVRGGLVTIRGRGLGHAVGMCQWCAKGMADRNMKLESILTAFYPGAKVQKLY